MKRCITWLLLLCMTAALLLPVQAAAAEDPVTEVIYLENGDSIVVTLEVMGARTSGTKTASKSYTYYNSLGNKAWTVTLTGTFTYTGTTSTCTKASSSITIYDSTWYLKAKSTKASGSSAIVNLTGCRDLQGSVARTESCTVTLTCDKNGNLS